MWIFMFEAFLNTISFEHQGLNWSRFAKRHTGSIVNLTHAASAPNWLA
jgi:hypothetical protein